MTTMGEFKQLLEGAPAAGQAVRPDLAAIMRNGRRLRWRRRAGTGTLAAVCSFAIAVPVAVQVGDDGRDPGTGAPASDGRDVEPTVEPTDPVEPTGPPPCGEWFCLGGGQRAEPLGAVIDTGDRIIDVPVLLFAEREQVVDPESGDTVPGATLKAGYRHVVSGDLLSSRWGVVADYPFPEQLPLPMTYSAGGGPWVVFGAVTDPAAASVVAIHPEGYPIPVELSDREVAPGIRVFWASGSMPDRELMGLDVRVLDANGETLAACTVGKCGVTG
jgi:hypothetical protein